MVGGKQGLPNRFRLKVGREAGCGMTFKPRGVQAISIEAVHLGQQLKTPANRLLFEVVAEGPVAKHFEKGVVVGVLAHILKVVVLAARANALLRVHGAGVVALSAAKEDILELVHACVCEQQRRIVVGDDRARRRECVPGPLNEKVDEGLADFRGGGGAGGVAGRWRGRRCGHWTSKIGEPGRFGVWRFSLAITPGDGVLLRRRRCCG